jgi:hypothetical protein
MIQINTEWTDEDWASLENWLRGILHINPVTVTFTKKDGTERVMRCTLQPELLPKVELKEGAKPRKESSASIRVFDLDKNEWRSFTVKSIKNIQTVIGEDIE